MSQRTLKLHNNSKVCSVDQNRNYTEQEKRWLYHRRKCEKSSVTLKELKMVAHPKIETNINA